MPECRQCEMSFPPVGDNPFSFPLTSYQTSLTAYPDLRPREAWLRKSDQPDETSKPGGHNAEGKTSDNSGMIKSGV